MIYKRILMSFLVLTSVVLSLNANATFSGGLEIMRVRVHAEGLVLFGASVQPANTCSSWGEYFIFDHTTASGKSLLSTLLTAKASGKTIQVWYINSTAVGTNQTSGCDSATMAKVTGIALP